MIKFCIGLFLIINVLLVSAQDDEVIVLNGVSVPSDFPHINISIMEETSPGKIFVANRWKSPYMMILENDGTPYFYKKLPWSTNDFKLQPTGTMTMRHREPYNTWVELDSNYNVIYDFRSPGYSLDGHEIQLLPNGNYLVIALDEKSIDMSQLVEGGQVDALVIGNHVQELDRNRNVLFEWRCWDHFDIVDAVHVDLTANSIDYVHMNAIAVDFDDHLLISSRHLSEITKINRQTGEIIWRLGGVNNQFQFINDEYGISYQHDIRPVPGKPNQYTIFDNGNFREPLFTRAVEFQLDTLNWTATKVWEYRHSPDRHTSAWGNAQRLPNGNTLINWAQVGLPKATEVTPSGEVVYEMDFIDEANCYRTFRFEWESIVDSPYLVAESHSDKVTLIFNKFGDKSVNEYRVYGGKNPNSNQMIASSSEPYIYLSELENYQTYFFRVTAVDSNGVESDFSNEEEVFVKYVEPGDNLILNGDFSQDSDYWELEISDDASGQGSVDNMIYHIKIDTAGVGYSDVLFRQNNLQIIENRQYVLEFDTWSSESIFYNVRVRQSSDNFTDYSKIGAIYSTAEWQHYKHEFNMNQASDYSAQIVFECGQFLADIYIDDVSLYYQLETSIEQTHHRHPTNYQLYSNYPNPFNPLTKINYELPIASHVDLSIYNLLGQKIAALVNERQFAGKHQVEWDASGFASGIYYYKIEVGDPAKQKGRFQDVKKMILLK